MKMFEFGHRPENLSLLQVTGDGKMKLSAPKQRMVKGRRVHLKVKLRAFCKLDGYKYLASRSSRFTVREKSPVFIGQQDQWASEPVCAQSERREKSLPAIAVVQEDNIKIYVG